MNRDAGSALAKHHLFGQVVWQPSKRDVNVLYHCIRCRGDLIGNGVIIGQIGARNRLKQDDLREITLVLALSSVVAALMNVLVR